MFIDGSKNPQNNYCKEFASVLKINPLDRLATENNSAQLLPAPFLSKYMESAMEYETFVASKRRSEIAAGHHPGAVMYINAFKIRPIDWVQVCASIKGSGLNYCDLAAMLGRPYSTVHGWMAMGHEPRHVDGERLLHIYRTRTGRDVPRI